MGSVQFKILPKITASSELQAADARLEQKFNEARQSLGKDYLLYNKNPPLSECEVDAVLESKDVV